MRSNVRELCNAVGIKNANQLAERGNFVSSTAYRIYAEGSTKVSPQVKERLCEVLQCDPEDLFISDRGFFVSDDEVYD